MIKLFKMKVNMILMTMYKLHYNNDGKNNCFYQLNRPVW